MLLAAGVTDLTPQTVSMTSIALTPKGSEVGCTVILTARRPRRGAPVSDPLPPIAEA